MIGAEAACADRVGMDITEDGEDGNELVANQLLRESGFQEATAKQSKTLIKIQFRWQCFTKNIHYGTSFRISQETR